jgi:hypothetical protein
VEQQVAALRTSRLSNDCDIPAASNVLGIHLAAHLDQQGAAERSLEEWRRVGDRKAQQELIIARVLCFPASNGATELNADQQKSEHSEELACVPNDRRISCKRLARPALTYVPLTASGA